MPAGRPVGLEVDGAGVVDQHIQAPIVTLNVGDSRGDGRWVSDIKND